MLFSLSKYYIAVTILKSLVLRNVKVERTVNFLSVFFRPQKWEFSGKQIPAYLIIIHSNHLNFMPYTKLF